MVNDDDDDFHGIDEKIDDHAFYTELLDSLILFYYISLKTSPPVYSVSKKVKINIKFLKNMYKNV